MPIRISSPEQCEFKETATTSKDSISETIQKETDIIKLRKYITN